VTATRRDDAATSAGVPVTSAGVPGTSATAPGTSAGAPTLPATAPATSATLPPPPRDGLGRPFTALVTGVLASNAADGFLYFAAPLLVLMITKDPVAVAATAAVMQAVPALFGVVAGSLADTRDRRLLMITTSLVRAVVLAGLLVLLWNDAVTLPALFVALALFAAAELTFDIASTASVPDVLRDLRGLERAHGVIGAGQQVLQGFIVGPLATLFFAWSAQLPFAIAAVMVVVSAVAVTVLRRLLTASAADAPPAPASPASPASPPFPASPATAHPDAAPADARLSFRERFAGGAVEVWSRPPLRRIVIFSIVIGTLAGFGQAAYAYYMVEFLGVAEAVLGLVFMALGVGGVLGSVSVHTLARRFGRRRTMLAGVILLAVGFAVVGAAPVGGWAPWVAAVGFFAAGLGSGWWNVLAVAARQRMVPTDRLGRVSGFVTTVYAFILPAVAMLGGWITRLDPRLPWYLTAAGSVAVVVLMGGMMRAVDDVAASPAASAPPVPAATASAGEGGPNT